MRTCRQCHNFISCMAFATSMQEDFDPDFEGEAHCGAKRFQPMTNADNIRAMSDEEFANFMAQKFADYSAAKMCEKGEPPTATYLHLERETWFRAWMQWLRQPVEVDMENKRRMMVNLEDIVDLDAQTKANNEAIRKVIAFMVGGAEEGK